jgi:hypothetical protein
METQDAFRAPDSLDLSPWDGIGEPFAASLVGEMSVTVRRGIVQKHKWLVAPRSATIRAPVEEALDRASSSPAFGDAAQAYPVTGDLLFQLDWRTADSAGGVPLLRTRIPYLEITPAKRVDGPSPVFPTAMGQETGYVDFQFVVGDLGVLVPGSVRVIGFSDEGFVASALKAIEESTFESASIAGCPVKQQVQQRVNFGPN